MTMCVNSLPCILQWQVNFLHLLLTPVLIDGELCIQVGKRQFHCDKCRICRVGGREHFFHCDQCGCCYQTGLQVGSKA
jgi:hypothetical protein